MDKELSEWLAVEEEEYDKLIPKYNKQLTKLHVFRFGVIAWIILSTLMLDLSIFTTIMLYGLSANLFIWLTSKARILFMKITIMLNIRQGTIDQLLQ